MILEQETFKKYGYYSKDLKPKSNKKIIAKCNQCGKERILQYGSYYDLCRKCATSSIEYKKKMSDALKGEKNPNYGKHRSEETKQKISEANKNPSEKIRKQISDAMSGKKHPLYGKHHSEDTKNKMSESAKGKSKSQIAKQKMSDVKQGKYLAENNPNWKGGISYEPYCVLFNNEFKERVREYWNRKCVICERTEKENGRKLNVHHVTYDKDICCNNSIPLFVTLCMSCHPKTNSKRKYWEDRFKRMIYSRNTDGKCFYSKKEMRGIKKKLK